MQHMSFYTVKGWIFAVLFILTIPVSNWVVMNVGLVCTADGPCVVPVWPGIMAPSGVLLAGLALVLRDGVHHFLGTRWAFYCIVGGTVLSAFLSEPSLVIASAVAFLFSETADLIVYTPLRRRFPAWAIVASGFSGSVVDSLLFLTIAFGDLNYIVGQVLGKFEMSVLAAVLILMMRMVRTGSVAAETVPARF